MVDKHSQPSYGNNYKFYSESVMVAVISSLEFHIDEIDSGQRCYDENDLHYGVVQGNKCCKQIKISGQENHCKHDLTFARYSCKNKKIFH